MTKRECGKGDRGGGGKGGKGLGDDEPPGGDGCENDSGCTVHKETPGRSGGWTIVCKKWTP